MLRFAQVGDTATSNGLKWLINGLDLIDKNIKAPQGFSFEVARSLGINNFFWTTNELAAYLFYKRYGFASSEVIEYFDPKLQKDKELYDLSSSEYSDKQFRCPEGLNYFPYQTAGIDYILQTRNTLVADQQRLGKTPMTLGVINNLPRLNKILIVCPKTAKFVWKQEADRWLIDNYKMQLLGARDIPDPAKDIYVTTYDNLHLQPALTRFNYDVIIADEVHLVKNLEARRAKYFFALQGKRRLGLSGTPLMNKPKDLLTVLQWIDPVWKQFYLYKDKFASKSGITLDLNEVQELARSSCMLRRIQAQVFDNAPNEKRLISLQAGDTVKDVIEKEKHHFSEYASARKQLGLYKVPFALQHLDIYSDVGDKIVAFAHHKEVIQRLLVSLGTKAVVLDGNSSDKERQDAEHRFQNDPDCRVFIGSIGAAAMAINLSVSNHILFVECDWTPGLMEQAEERCATKDKIEPVLIEYMVFENSLDYQMLNNISRKQLNCDKGLDTIYE